MTGPAEAPFPADSPQQPDLDAIVETIIYLYTESRRLTKGSPVASASPGRSSPS